MKKALRLILLSLAVLFTCINANAGLPSLKLDSIATWGAFPRFAVNTYRWGDKFFNGYDTTYVTPTGYKFNGKITTSCWTDTYNFLLPNDKRISMVSDASTSMGFYLTYLAVSVGYDVNINKLFRNKNDARKRFRFGFNCMLFAAEAYYIKNDEETTIRRFGDRKNPTSYKLPFRGIDNTTWGLDAYYFFNHKRYSEAAAFSYSRIQKKSQGSFYTGFSLYNQNLNFDFHGMPAELIMQLPPSWKQPRFSIDTHNYAIRVGYGYNWVFHPRWVLGVSESPILGISTGYINSTMKKTNFSMYNRTKLAVVYNNGRWFCAATGKLDIGIVSNEKTLYAGGTVSGEIVVGYRFNLW